MLEAKGDIWHFHEKGEWISITTNGNINSNGECIMGKGVALDAKKRFKELPRKLGIALRNGNMPIAFNEYRIITFPTKNNWRDNSDIDLIRQSAISIVTIVDSLRLSRLYIPRPGCGNGNLKWEVVKHILINIFDNRFIILNN